MKFESEMESFSRTISQLSFYITSAYFSGAPATPTKQSLTVSTFRMLFFFCPRDRYLANLVNVVFVRENVEHAKHLVQGRHNLHAVALLADVPESFKFLRLQNGEVAWQVASHPKTGMSLKTMVTISKTSQVSTAEAPFWTKKSFFCQRTRGCHLDLLGDRLGHHLTEEVVALLHLYVKLCHALLCKNIGSKYILLFLFWFLPPSTWSSRFPTPARPSTRRTVGCKERGMASD